MKLVLALLVVLATCTAAQAAPQQPLAFSLVGVQQADRVIEQLSDWPYSADSHLVHNSTPCSWSVNDHWNYGGSGYVDSGQAVTHQGCVVAGYQPTYRCINGHCAWWSGLDRKYGVAVASKSQIEVSLCYQPQARCFVASPVYDSSDREYKHELCVRVRYRSDDLALYEIPGSSAGVGTGGFGELGGYGVQTQVTTTIRNPGSRRVSVKAGISQVSASGSLSIDQGPGCPVDVQLPNEEYPFQWR